MPTINRTTVKYTLIGLALGVYCGFVTLFMYWFILVAIVESSGVEFGDSFFDLDGDLVQLATTLAGPLIGYRLGLRRWRSSRIPQRLTDEYSKIAK